MCSSICLKTFLFGLLTISTIPFIICQSSFLSSLPLRNFALTSDTSFNFDLSLVIPIPVIGNITVDVEVELPLRIHFMNSSIAYRPIKIPYFILPEPKPITFDLTNHDQDSYYSYGQDPYTYDSYYAPEYNNPYYESSQWVDGNRRNLLSPKKKTLPKKNAKRKKYPKSSNSYLHSNQANWNNTFQYYHRRHKRSVAESSVQHRLDLFTVFEETLNQYGLDGQSCVCRAVCEMAEMEFMIESPVHEVIEHLFRVSRAYDSDGLLSQYVEAEKLGHKSFKQKNWHSCSKRYYQCPFSIFDRTFSKAN